MLKTKIILLLLLLLPVVNAQMTIETYVDDVVFMDSEYTRLFKIKNTTYSSGGDYVSVTVNYNLSKNNTLVFSDFFTVDVKSYKYANTGTLVIGEVGEFVLCGQINNSEQIICKTINVIDTNTIPCNVSLELTSTKKLYENNESIKYSFELDETFDYEIEYWIEDVFKNILKKKYNTSNDNQKSYTPKFSETDKAFILCAKLHAKCNNTNENIYDEKLVVKKGVERYNSEVELLDYPTEATFGDIVHVKTRAFRGDSGKTVVYIRIPNAATTSKFYINSKFSEAIVNTPVQLKPNCNGRLKNKDYDLLIEGLDNVITKKIHLSGTSTKNCDEITKYKTKTSTSKTINYEIIDYEPIILIGTTAKTKLLIENNDDEKHSFSVYSYIYRGPKSYSGERDANTKTITLQASTDAQITLENIVLEGESGDYKLKVVIRKDDLKTPYELTKTVSLQNPLTVQSGVQEASAQSASFESVGVAQPIISIASDKLPVIVSRNSIIYESKQVKLKKQLAYIVLTGLMLFNVFYFLGRKNL